MKLINYWIFSFWGTEYKKRFLWKWYDGYSGLYIFGRDFFGFWFQDRNVVIDLTKRPFKTKRVIDLTINLFNFVFVLNLLEINKSKLKCNSVFNNDSSRWYNGFTGVKIFGLKFLGFSIVDGYNEDDIRYCCVFLYIFGIVISINNRGGL